ncbi:hypothetical protein OAS39_09450 [Pirellulales bacterium]|nr:hypothetical protein [Pirellulales bacterium]
MKLRPTLTATLLILSGPAAVLIADDDGPVSVDSFASASLVTLDVEGAEIGEVLKAIGEQTGNRVEDYRARFNERVEPVSLRLKFDRKPFWPAVDELLDLSGMGPYHYSEAGVLALSKRPAGAPPRVGRAEYAGPFRLEVAQVSALRNFNQPQENRLYAEIAIAWEPRLKPIGLVQAADDVAALGNNGDVMAMIEAETTKYIDIAPDDSKAELAIALPLPERAAVQTASISGTLRALIPQRHAKFKFEDLDIGGIEEQSDGGVFVSLDRVVDNEGLWEFHMRLRVEDEVVGLAALRGWVFQNSTYLIDAEGRILDHVGFETATTTDQEVGLVYLFEIPDDWSEYAWVYETPVAITSVPVKYELADIPLP